LFYLSEVNDISVAGKYTPTEIDRGGLMLSCTDTEHSNWKGGNTEQTVTVTPQCKQHYFVNIRLSVEIMNHM